LLDNCSYSLYVFEAHVGLTGKFDQIGPNSFRVGKRISDIRFISSDNVDGNIASLNLIALPGQSFNQACG